MNDQTFYPPITPDLIAEFRDQNNQLFDPETVTFKLLSPSDIQIDYIVGTNSEASRLSTGIYRLRRVYTSSDSGDWCWHVQGDQVVATTGNFTVLTSKF